MFFESWYGAKSQQAKKVIERVKNDPLLLESLKDAFCIANVLRNVWPR